MADFRILLQKPIDSVEKPKAMPAGTYHGKISKYEPLESKEKRTPYIRFYIDVLAAGDDVDAAQLEGVKLQRQVRKDYFLTDDALWRFKEFMESCFDTTGRSFHELLPNVNGQSVILEITQRPSQDGSELYNDVGKVLGQKES